MDSTKRLHICIIGIDQIGTIANHTILATLILQRRSVGSFRKRFKLEQLNCALHKRSTHITHNRG